MKKTIRLNNGVEMPLLSFGTFQIDPQDTQKAVQQAINAGYRSVDTAFSYENESEVGKAIKASGVIRDDLFITSKAYIPQMGYYKTQEAIDQSLRKLGLDYLDLYLIHMPFGDYYGAWQAMMEAQQAGKIRAIGVSNFDSARLMDLNYNFQVTPQVNQIEHHPHFQRGPEIKEMKKLDITPEAWAPFAEGMGQMFDEPTLQKIAQKCNKSIAQVILRWNIQQGIPTIAKSLNPVHMKQNLAVFDFTLDTKEMQDVACLDTGKPSMLDINKPSEVKRLYNYLKNPVVTSL